MSAVTQLYAAPVQPFPWPGPSQRSDLTGPDYRALVGAAIDPDVAYEAGVRSSDAALVEAAGLGHWLKKNPADGILFYLHRHDGSVTPQWRPSVALRVGSEDKPRKYLFPTGAHCPIVLHPRMRDITGSTSDVLIVEGTKQLLAAISHAPADTLVLGVAGCWGWSKDRSAVPDLAALIPSGARVTVIFDGDVATNPMVWKAAAALEGHLGTLNATARWVTLDPGADGHAGLDDELAQIDTEHRATALQDLVDAGSSLPDRPDGFLDSGRAVRGPRVFRQPQTEWADALTHGGWSVINRDDDRTALVAVHDGDIHGIFRLAQGDKEWEPSQLTTWVPWRSTRVQMIRGKSVVGDATWRVRIDTAARTWSADLDDKESLSPQSVQERTGAAIALPEGRSDLNTVRTTLAMLGADTRTVQDIYTSTGWHVIDGKPTFVAPAGSITPDGIRTDLQVDTPQGSQVEPRIGWTRVPTTSEEHHAGLRALAALSTILPKRPDVGHAIVGALTASALGLPRRTSLMLQAEKGAGKTVLAGAVMSAMCEVEQIGFVLSIPQASALGAVSAMEWSRNLLLIADDYRRSSDSHAHQVNTSASQILAKIAQGTYSGDAEKKRTQTGALRAASDINTMALITAETLSTEAAITERMVVLQLAKDDFPDVTDPDDSIRAFRDEHIATGNLALGFAGYLRHLAQFQEAGHDLSSVGSKQVAAARQALGHKRAGETVAVLGVGWRFLRLYATHVGAESLLPSGLAVGDVLSSIVQTAATTNTEADPCAVLVKAIREMISGGQGHLLPGDRSIADQQAIGWRLRGENMVPVGAELGELGINTVVIRAAGLKAAMRYANLEGLNHTQGAAALAKACIPDSTPGQRVPASVHPGRIRGFALSWGLILDD